MAAACRHAIGTHQRANTNKQREYRLTDAEMTPAASERSPNMRPEGALFVFMIGFILFLVVGLVCVSSRSGPLILGIAELICIMVKMFPPGKRN